MPTVFSHPVVPLTVALCAGDRAVPPKLLWAGVAASILPDLDAVSFMIGVPYTSVYGHRGVSHSLTFAAVIGLCAAAIAPRLSLSRWAAFMYVSMAYASHGLLDMLTDGGRGIAFLWPLSSERYFLPWQVIKVSPIAAHRFLSSRGLEVLQSELLWIWLPSTLAVLACHLLWRKHAV